MIKNITIKNYKSVVNTTLPLSTFNVMIGANGCGKSNILEAIAIAAASSSNKLDYEYFANRGIRIVEPRYMLPAFEDVEADDIQIQITDDKEQTSEFNIRYNKNAKPPKWEDTNARVIHVQNLKEQIDAEQNYASLNERILLSKDYYSDDLPRIEKLNNPCRDLYKFTIYSLEESVLRKADNDSRLYPIGRHGEGLFAYLKYLAAREDGMDIISEISENLDILDWFDGMEIPKGQLSQEFNVKLKDRYLDETISFFDQRSTNEGFLYLLFYLTLIISDETPAFFAIENIDASFNPKLCHEVINRLTELVKKHGKQIIATTHNPSVLDGLNIEDNGQKLLVVRRNIDGYTKVNDVETKGKLNMSLSEAWVKGFIGGLPDNF